MGTPPTVIYNDTCPICAREVAGYKRMVARHGVEMRFRGLSEGGLADYGLTPRDAARRLHVLDGGRLVSGIPAFALIWERIPRLRWLARTVRAPLIGPAARLVYDHLAAPLLFAMHRRREGLGKAVRRG